MKGHPQSPHLAWTCTLEWKIRPESNAVNSKISLEVRIIFYLKAKVVQSKTSCLLLSAMHSSLLADWSSPNMCVCESVPPGSCLPPLDWTPVAFAVKGHSTWVDILSLTSATNLPEPGHSKAPLWSRQQPCDCLSHTWFTYTPRYTHTHTQSTHICYVYWYIFLCIFMHCTNACALYKNTITLYMQSGLHVHNNLRLVSYQTKNLDLNQPKQLLHFFFFLFF